ncbi:MAG TPA: bifunctional precorrin-2 dehydrogenase/sirohydrochlorin ferrochelatase [Vicinamibacteria bacterium]|nr:bifunctional precorrin-2 dehydrogenase/sirohydrochlorin ferrochelatase [Vicinamibacteria bacterium]
MSLPLFPVFLKLEGRAVLLVGGGRIAAARLPALLAAGASVTVVAPLVRDEVAAQPVRVERRGFRPEDLDGAWLVVAAADRETNRAVAEAAERARVFVNAVDDVESASVYTGGVLRRGGVTVAVSTEGRAPALAGLMREALEALLPDDPSGWVEVAARTRLEQRQAGVPISQRRPLLLRALEELYASRPVNEATW